MFYETGTSASTTFIFCLLFLLLPYFIATAAACLLDPVFKSIQLRLLTPLVFFSGLYPLYDAFLKFWNPKNGEPMSPSRIGMKGVSIVCQSAPQSVIQLYSTLEKVEALSYNSIVFFLLSVTASYLSIGYGICSLFKHDSIMILIVAFLMEFTEATYRLVTASLFFAMIKAYSIIVYVGTILIRASLQASLEYYFNDCESVRTWSLFRQLSHYILEASVFFCFQNMQFYFRDGRRVLDRNISYTALSSIIGSTGSRKHYCSCSALPL